MTANLLAGLIMFMGVPLMAVAQSEAGQTTVTKTIEKNGKKKTKTRTMPDWAAAQNYSGDQCVYFPDYYTFYEPGRGYVYWNNGAWTSAGTLPSYMTDVNLNRARMQILNDVSARPETRYRNYIESYPAQKVEVAVPVPGAR